MSSYRLVVDGALIKAWASHKSFRSKDEQEPPQEPGVFKGKKHSNATRESTTDPDTRLMRKSDIRGSQRRRSGPMVRAS